MTASFDFIPAIQNKKQDNNDQEFEDNNEPFEFTKASDISNNKEDQSFLNYLGETGAQLFSRGLERIIGLPGDVSSLGKGLITGEINPFQQLSGENKFQLPGQKELSQNREKNIEESNILPTIKKLLSNEQFGPSPFELPTSEDIKKGSEKLTGGLTKPKDEFQRIASEAFETFTDIALPGAGGKFRGAKPSIGRSVARKLGTAIGAQIPKEVLKSYGFSESAQDAAKLGSLFTLSLTMPRIFGERSVQNVYGDLYKERDALIPANANITSGSINNKLNNLKTRLSGIQSESTRPVISAINDLEKEISSGNVNVHDLLKNMRRINENRSGLYKLNLSKPESKQLKRNYTDFYKILDDEFENYAKTSNPEALKFHRQGNEVFGAYNESNKASKEINKFLRKYPYSPAISILFKDLAPAFGPETIAAGAASLAAYNSFKVLNRIYKSPELRKYYTNVLTNAIKEDSVATLRALQQLDNALKKENP